MPLTDSGNSHDFGEYLMVKARDQNEKTVMVRVSREVQDDYPNYDFLSKASEKYDLNDYTFNSEKIPVVTVYTNDIK